MHYHSHRVDRVYILPPFVVFALYKVPIQIIEYPIDEPRVIGESAPLRCVPLQECLVVVVVQWDATLSDQNQNQN